MAREIVVITSPGVIISRKDNPELGSWGFEELVNNLYLRGEISLKGYSMASSQFYDEDLEWLRSGRPRG